MSDWKYPVVPYDYRLTAEGKCELHPSSPLILINDTTEDVDDITWSCFRCTLNEFAAPAK